MARQHVPGHDREIRPQDRDFKFWPLQGDENIDAAQINMVSPQSSDVDGKVWAQNNGFAGVHRLDIATGKIETWEPFKGVPGPHNIYDVIPDSRNNVYFTDFRQRHIGRIDAKTGEVKFSRSRRRFRRRAAAPWMRRTGCGSANIAATASACSTQRPASSGNGRSRRNGRRPTTSSTDKNGEAWTGSMLSDQVTRLNPETGEAINYLLPRSTNIRRVFVDNSTTPVTFWAGSNHGASIVKVEPLE